MRHMRLTSYLTNDRNDRNLRHERGNQVLEAFDISFKPQESPSYETYLLQKMNQAF